MGTMKNKQNFCLLIFLTTFMLTGWMSNLSAQNTGSNERYNLAVYATGMQNDQPLSTSIQTVVQNKTITKLTGEGNYRLIERSNEFLRQIQNEQTIQQSGDVADGQIAEIGAGYGAQKICVVSVTIINQYLYIATRIVDVATKTSYESGDAEITNYRSVPDLTKALEQALNKMIDKSNTNNRVNTQINIPMTSKASTPSEQNYVQYKKRVKKEDAGFLSYNSLAYKEYKKWKGNMIWGSILFPTGLALAGVGWTYFGVDFYYTSGLWWLFMAVPGTIFLSTSIALFCTMDDHLRKSYHYYLNGDQRVATLHFYPYYGGNNTFGAGLTLRF